MDAKQYSRVLVNFYFSFFFFRDVCLYISYIPMLAILWQWYVFVWGTFGAWGKACDWARLGATGLCPQCNQSEVGNDHELLPSLNSAGHIPPPVCQCREATSLKSFCHLLVLSKKNLIFSLEKGVLKPFFFLWGG